MEKYCFHFMYSKQDRRELDINLIYCSTTVSKAHCNRFISYFQYITLHEKTVQQEILNFMYLTGDETPEVMPKCPHQHSFPESWHHLVLCCLLFKQLLTQGECAGTNLTSSPEFFSLTVLTAWLETTTCSCKVV